MKKIYLILTLLSGVLYANFTFGQVYYPGGATCETAVPIPIGGYYETTAGEGVDHWYKFLPPCDGIMRVAHSSYLFACDKRVLLGECDDLETIDYADTWSIWTDWLPMNSGEPVYIKITSHGEAQFQVQYSGCDVIDPALLDIQGTVFYDLNDNGIRDTGELGQYSNIIHTDPFAGFAFTNSEGYYYHPMSGFPDGTYELSPTVEEHWEISTDSLFYTIHINEAFVPRDSLDFGITPDTLIYEVRPGFTTSRLRCNDTVNFWLSVTNTGTTIAAGLIDLELDDSIYFVSADMAPDSIVGQHIYWHYEGLYIDEYESILVRVGTPDGVDDTIVNNLTVSIVSAGVEMFSETLTRIGNVLCAFDPNDKTPDPLGVGEFGFIAPDTETIEYLVRFQNTGTDTAINVVIKDQFDENLDWNTFELLSYSHNIELAMTIDGEMSFIFNEIMLPDSNVNELASHGFVLYRVDLLPGLPLETSIFNTAHIYFDLNPAIVTNTTINTLHIDNTSIDELVNEQKLLVYPNPFTETTTVYFGEDLINHSIQIVDIMGKVVYTDYDMNGNKVEIDASSLTEGMYILLLIDNESNQVISNAKLMVK